MKDIPEVPDKSTGDLAYTVVKAAMSAIPAVGGSAAELLGLVFGPPLEKRRTEWSKRLAEAVRELQERADGITPETLAADPVFVTTAMHATQVAIRTHQEEKLVALRNAVVNSATATAPQDDLKAIFLNLVDAFTPTHLKILKYFQNRGTLDATAIQRLRDARAITDVIVNELARNGLIEDHRPYAARGRDSGDSLLISDWTVSQLGSQFIAFISSRPTRS
jgi:hypothetical protein